MRAFVSQQAEGVLYPQLRVLTRWVFAPSEAAQVLPGYLAAPFCSRVPSDSLLKRKS